VQRGNLYRVAHPTARDPKRSRVFVIVSRQILIDSRFSTVICAPVYTTYDGLSTQVPVGIEEGLKHDSSIHCDELISIPKSALTNFVASLSHSKMESLNQALMIALDLSERPPEFARLP
jgi:mRNA interferase MazF